MKKAFLDFIQLSLAVIYCIIGVLIAEAPGPFPLDRLSPYGEGRHGSGRSRREISLCQHVSWKNKTYEEYHTQPSFPEVTDLQYEVHKYADTVQYELDQSLSVHRSRYLLGTIAFVKNPYYTLSVLEPSEPGGCEVKYLNTIRSTVSTTASKRKFGCKLASNAGYFSVTNGQCLGNVVADGRVVQTTADQNANFGIREDGTIVVGYIPEEEIVNHSYRQLVAGVIWLVRNGTNYVNESMLLECASHQDTGAMATFVNVWSARTAVGHDKDGRVVIANIDGQTHKRGANLHEFADLLIAHGVVNAINLDGGGSSTFVKDQNVINYPSDHCHDPVYRCEREVSTVLCFHDVECLEPSCNDHGSCLRGECSCSLPWTGSACNLLNCSLTNCSSHGNCTEGKCMCESGWQGDQCDEVCSAGTYGPGCTLNCWCYGKSFCDPDTGACKCPPGYTGFGCWKECDDGFYGLDCLSRCPMHNCSGHGKCSAVDGACLCTTNWTGLVCNHTLSEDTEVSTAELSVSAATALTAAVFGSVSLPTATSATSISDGATSVSDGVTSISDGATSISDGATSISDGATSISDGATSISDGATSISDGATSISDGATSISDGATSISDGATSISDGATSISDGATSILVEVVASRDCRTGSLVTSSFVPSTLLSVPNSRSVINCPQVVSNDQQRTQECNYGMAIFVLCMIATASVLVHIFICIKFVQS